MGVVEGRMRPMLPCDDVGMMRELIDLICLCWDGNPSMRPSFATITCSLKSYVQKLLHSSAESFKSSSINDSCDHPTLLST